MGVYDINRILVPEAPPEYEDHSAQTHFVPAPCQVACPIGTDAPSYIGYIWEGKFDEAGHLAGWRSLPRRRISRVSNMPRSTVGVI